MVSKEEQVSAQGTILNSVGLLVEGGKTAVTYTYKLFKSYIESLYQNGALCKRSLSEEPLAIKGQHMKLLCVLIKASDQLKFTKILNGFGVDFNLVSSRDVPFTLFVTSEPVAIERAVKDAQIEIVSFCYLSLKDTGLPDKPDPVNKES